MLREGGGSRSEVCPTTMWRGEILNKWNKKVRRLGHFLRRATLELPSAAPAMTSFFPPSLFTQPLWMHDDGGARQRESTKQEKRGSCRTLQKNIEGTGGHMAEVMSAAEDGSAGGLAGMETRPPLPTPRHLGREANLSQVITLLFIQFVCFLKWPFWGVGNISIQKVLLCNHATPAAPTTTTSQNKKKCWRLNVTGVVFPLRWLSAPLTCLPLVRRDKLGNGERFFAGSRDSEQL